MNLCVRVKYLRLNFVSSLCRYANTQTEVVDKNEIDLVDDDDEIKAREAIIEKNRNISKLSKAHYNLVNGRKPYDTPKSLVHLTVKYHRKMYGKFGSASGVDPSLCFPSRAEIEERISYESVAYPFTIQQMIESAAQRKLEEKEKIEKREMELATKMLKLDQWKKELHDRIAKKERDVQIAKEKKERLVEEVRRHFGFKLDPRDERFKEMLAKREKEQKKQEKLAKREAKEKTMIAKLQQKNAEISEKAQN